MVLTARGGRVVRMARGGARGGRMRAAAAAPPAAAGEEVDLSLLKPLQGRVVVEALEVEAKSSGGILLPSAANEANKQDPVFATVLAVSDGVDSVSVGQTVIFEGFAGNEVEFGERQVLFVKADDVLAVCE